MHYGAGIPPSAVHGCEAGVRYLVAPEAQYEAVKKMWAPSGMGGQILPQWDYAMGMRVQQWGAQQNQIMQAQGRFGSSSLITTRRCASKCMSSFFPPCSEGRTCQWRGRKRA